MPSNHKRWPITDIAASGQTTLVTVGATQRLILRNFLLAVRGDTDIFLCNQDGKQMTVTFPVNGILLWEGQGEYNLDFGLGKDMCVNSSNATDGEIMVSYDLQDA